MVVVKNNVMYSCRVFYIGSAGIEEGKKGVEALQAPLRERYRGNANLCEGEDMTITVMPEFILFQPSDGGRGTDLHISTLSICAAVRCVESHGEPGNMKFVPVHSVITAHEPSSEHPAIFSTVMRREEGAPLECFAFICNETRDALHLVNATQTAHSTMQRGYSPSGAMKFFIDQSTEFDRTIRLQSTSGERRAETRKVYTYHEDYDTRDIQRSTIRHHLTSDENAGNVHHISKVYNDENVVVNGDSGEDRTIYIRANVEQEERSRQEATEGETIVIGYDRSEEQRPRTPPPRQTIIIDKPVIKEAPPIEIPKPDIIERKVFIEPPRPPKIEQQKIIVDVPVFKEFPKWDPPPPPDIQENRIMIEPPPPPKLPRQRIIVDKPVLMDYPRPETPPPPDVVERKVMIEPPPWPKQKAQRIIVDTPVIGDFKPPPSPPPPIVEKREVYIDPPDYPPQKPHRIVVEKPVFNPQKPAPRPPTPEIITKNVMVDPPPFPPQERQRIIVEKPVIRAPERPPRAPSPDIIEKIVYVDGPKWPEQPRQKIIVEKVVVRPPGPPPPPPPPIVQEKIVYVDPPPWPKPKPQTIVVERPVFRQQAPQPQVKPIIVDKPVVVEAPPPPPAQRQKVIVERPVFRTTYNQRTVPTGYAYERTVPAPANYRSSYVVTRASGSPRGLRRYAWSDHGGDTRLGETSQSAYRLYGQPRDFRRSENQFMNERGFARRLTNEEDLRYSRGPGSYTYGVNRRGSVSS